MFEPWEYFNKLPSDILCENYAKIMDYYEGQEIADKLAEVPERYKVNKGNPHNWEIKILKDNYMLYNQYGTLNIYLNCSIRLAYLDIHQLNKFISYDCIDQLCCNILQQEIDNYINSTELYLKVKDVECFVDQDINTLMVVLQFRVVLSMDNPYYISLQYIQQLENNMPYIIKIINKVTFDIRKEIIFRLEEENKWKTNTMR